MTETPRGLRRVARWLLDRRFGTDHAAEIEGDLLELWRVRHAAGRQDLGRAFLRDLAGVLRPRVRRRIGTTGARRGSPGHEGALTMLHDIRFALRVIRRQPALAITTMATLGIGIAAATSIFTAVDRLLVRPLPYPAPDELFVVTNAPYDFSAAGMDLSRTVPALDAIADAGLFAVGGVNVTAGGEAIRVPATTASPGFFGALGVRATIGRAYTTADVEAAQRSVAVISAELWRRLGGQPAVLDRPLTINLRPYRVVGVMPPGFAYPGRTDVWLPPGADLQLTGQAFAPDVIARVAQGVSPEAAAAAINQLRASQGEEPPEDRRTELVPLHEELTGSVRPLMLLLAASVSLLLIVSCSNTASLLLSKVARRQQEFVVRRALGGSRWRLARLMLTESLVLSLAAGAIGIAGAMLVLRVVPTLVDQPLPGVDLTALDLRLLLIALAVSIGTGVLFSLAPGVAASAQPASQIVRGTVTAAGSRSWRWFRHTLVVLQVAAALVLLAVTGATVGTMVRLASIDLGFGNANAVALEVTLPIERYDTPERLFAFYQDAADRLAAVPGVVRVGATGVLPGYRSTGVGLRLAPAGLADDLADDLPFASMLFASPGYFEALGIRVLAGRPFLASDAAGSAPVVVLSESQANVLFPDGRDPVGEVVRISTARGGQYEVIGVVSDVLLRGPTGAERPRQFYQSILQSPPFGAMAFVVDATTPATALIPQLRLALADVDRDLPMYNAEPVPAITGRFLASHRLAMSLMGGFALMTLVLASVGLYGVLSQVVAQRTREIGIRMALGADGRRLRRGLLLQGLRLAAIGIAIGAAAAGLAARLIASFVPSLDPPAWPIIAAQAVVLLGVAALATWIPARRAARIDPLAALRTD